MRDLENHRLRGRVKELSALRNALLGQLTDRDDQISILTRLAKARPLAPVKAPNRAGRNPKQRVGCPVMLCSDWHVEEPVDPATVNGCNEYNLKIANACIDRLPEAFNWLMRDKRFDCRTGIVWLGGDLISGYIHAELEENNFLSPVKATLWLLPRIERMLRIILADSGLESLIVPCNDGNHGRLTHKIRVSTRTANSIEWLLYQTLAARMADEPRIRFQVAAGEWNYLDVFDRTLAFTHGDSFRYQGGVGGLTIPLRRGMNEIRKYRKVDYVSMGHFHQRMDLGDICVNGSMIGPTPYSVRIHAQPEQRQQSWFMLDSTRGKALSAPVWL